MGEAWIEVNGKRLECTVGSIELTRTEDEYSSWCDSAYSVSGPLEVQFTGLVVKTSDLPESIVNFNEPSGDTMDARKTTALKIKELEKTKEEATLSEYGIIDSNGLLTSSGETVLLNELFTAEVKKSIIEKLKRTEP